MTPAELRALIADLETQEPTREMADRVLERFMAKVSPEPNSGCWLWTAQCNDKGYGRFYLNGTTIMAHRISYALFKGPFPLGHQTDHLCQVKCCVNPDHLEAVTASVNVRRQRRKSPRKFCPRGHLLTGHNLLALREGNTCRECNRLRCLDYRRKKKGEPAHFLADAALKARLAEMEHD